MFFTTVTSVLALASFASAAAPSVIYPHQGTVWENTWFHNVTWAPQSGTGNIMLTHGGTMTTLINNVDLSTGRVVIQVPKSVMQAQDWIVQIAAGGDTSSSNAFAIGPPSAVAPGGGSSASGSASGSATGTAASASSISASAGSSAAASAASSLSSMASMSMSGSSVVSSAASSISSEFNSASASAQSQFSSLINSASSAGQSSLSSVLSSASESAASKSSSVQASATAPASSSSGASSGAAPLGFSMFGATIAAGLVAITTLSGALVL